jgi:hypothetical protein
MHLSVEELLHYTGEERRRWEQWFQENGEDLLRMPIAGSARIATVGALIVHIFGSELGCVQQLRDERLSEYRGRPCERIEEVFGFGLETRRAMRDFVRSADKADSATAGRAVLHALLHEVRHWAHVERIMIDRGIEPPGEHDLLTSSALI